MRRFGARLLADGKLTLGMQCDQAKEAYERVLQDNPNHAKVLQQLGGLYCHPRASFYSPEYSVDILTKSLETGPLPRPNL